MDLAGHVAGTRVGTGRGHSRVAPDDDQHRGERPPGHAPALHGVRVRSSEGPAGEGGTVSSSWGPGPGPAGSRLGTACQLGSCCETPRAPKTVAWRNRKLGTVGSPLQTSLNCWDTTGFSASTRIGGFGHLAGSYCARSACKRQGPGEVQRQRRAETETWGGTRRRQGGDGGCWRLSP